MSLQNTPQTAENAPQSRLIRLNEYRNVTRPKTAQMTRLRRYLSMYGYMVEGNILWLENWRWTRAERRQFPVLYSLVRAAGYIVDNAIRKANIKAAA